MLGETIFSVCFRDFLVYIPNQRIMHRVDCLQLKLASKWLVALTLILITISALIIASTKATVPNAVAEEKTEGLF